MKAVMMEPDKLPGLVGQIIYMSEWTVMTQPMIQAYADVSGDQQYIHTDPARCANGGGYGGRSTTICHGEMTTTRAVGTMSTNVGFEGHAMTNASNDTKYESAVPVGSETRVVMTLENHRDRGEKPDIVWLVVQTWVREEGVDEDVVAATSKLTLFLPPDGS